MTIPSRPDVAASKYRCGVLSAYSFRHRPPARARLAGTMAPHLVRSRGFGSWQVLDRNHRRPSNLVPGYQRRSAKKAIRLAASGLWSRMRSPRGSEQFSGQRLLPSLGDRRRRGQGRIINRRKWPESSPARFIESAGHEHGHGSDLRVWPVQTGDAIKAAVQRLGGGRPAASRVSSASVPD